MNEIQWINYKKRIEIAYEKGKGFKPKRNFVDFLIHAISFVFAFLAVMVGLCSSWILGLNAIILEIDTDTAETTKLALKNISTLPNGLLGLCAIVLLTFVAFSYICFQIEHWLTVRNINFEIYLSELLKIINENEEYVSWKSMEKTTNDKLVSDINV